MSVNRVLLINVELKELVVGRTLEILVPSFLVNAPS
jgi:hypothetical protein